MHEPDLPLVPVVLIPEGQLDHVAAIRVVPEPGVVDVVEAGQDLPDGGHVLLADVDDGAHQIVGPEQRGEGGHRVEHTAVLVEDLAAVGDDVVAWDGAEDGDLARASRTRAIAGPGRIGRG